MTRTTKTLLAVACGFIWLPLIASSQEFDEQFDHWPIDLKINGTLVVGDGLADVSVLKNAVPRGKDAKVALLTDAEPEAAVVEQFKTAFGGEGDSLSISQINGDLAGQLEDVCKKCQVVCWHSTKAPGELPAEALSRICSVCNKQIADGGSIIALGPAAKQFASRYFTAAEKAQAVREGLGIAPDCVIELNYDHAGDARPRMLSALAAYPRSVGIGIEKGSAMVLRGRKIRVVGNGTATFMLMANERQPLRVQTIGQQSSTRQRPDQYLVDLTEWRRDAMDRTLDPFPAAEPKTPHVEKGSLVIVGGGRTPAGLMGKFVELAGGAENAKLVYVACSERDEISPQQRTVEAWKKMGVKHAVTLHTKDRNKANSDEEFLAPLKDATGLWFAGGRQWNFSDSYYGTKAHELMKQVVTRGGVVGGSSAGASIQARYLARATPIGNWLIMAPGYERGGLGFICGVAIDQHFSQRGRQKDMTQLVNRYPQLLGIGIDESTAIIVRNSAAEVVGRGKVHFYDRKLPVYPDRPDYIALPAGSVYDLAERLVVKDATAAEPPAEKEPAEKCPTP